MFKTIHCKILTLLIVCLTIGIVSSLMASAASSGIVKRVYTDKARYNTGNTVTIKVNLTNDTGAVFNSGVSITIYYNETQQYTSSQTINLANGDSTTLTYTWTAPATNHRGYYVKVAADTVGTGGTGIDVSNDWIQYPRYGFMSEFPVGESSASTDARVKQTTEDYHTVAFQLYDWMWRHENMIKRTNGVIDSSWKDWSDKLTISWPTVQNLIYTYDGVSVDMDNRFAGFVNNLRSDLNANALSNKVVTFNVVNGSVDGWAAADVTKNAQTDFDYSEIWENADDYIELKDYVNYARKNDGGKALVLAAYMNYEENLGTRYEAESATLFNVTTNTNHAGYTGTGFVDGFGESGDYVEFSISAPEASKYAH